MKKITKKILSLIIVSALVLTMGISAFAEEGAAPTLVKTLDIAEGVTVPNATFNFKLEELSALSGENDPVVSTGSSGFNVSTTISATDAAAAGGKSIALSELFANAEFPHAGVYAYKLTEEAATYTHEDNATLTCNTGAAEYTVIVVAGNGDEGKPVVSEILIRDKKGDKTGSAAFNNKYEKTNDDKALTVSKTVAGAMGDKKSDFTFTLTITKPADSAIPTAPVGKIGSESVTLAWGENEIQLKDGETLDVTGVPYGSTYQVVEAATDSSIQNYASYETKVVVNGTEKSGKDTGSTLLSDTTANTVAFTNTLREIPITGVIINTLPYILIVAIAAAGFLYMQMKKRA